ncbi:MAG: hypothetical protein HOO06_15860 [Bdellovibrionaceae bacterium]|jgi:hypothetical protein|nr:hypothetical protein [Pseudobdellovibrionaceae bacterium]
MKNKLHIFLALISAIFGILTIKTGALFLFTPEGQIAAGDYVPFVLWFNFIAGFFYFITGIGIYFKKTWTYKAAITLAILTSIVFAAFGFHVALGGLYEVRTVGAIIFRTLFWVFISFGLGKVVFKKPQN